jgi:hypothetical protein
MVTPIRMNAAGLRRQHEDFRVRRAVGYNSQGRLPVDGWFSPDKSRPYRRI